MYCFIHEAIKLSDNAMRAESSNIIIEKENHTLLDSCNITMWTSIAAFITMSVSRMFHILVLLTPLKIKSQADPSGFIFYTAVWLTARKHIICPVLAKETCN